MEEKKKLFGKGVYGSKDVPIKMLDKLIAGIILTIIILAFVFANDNGFAITFETDGGSEVDSQKVEYGEYIVEPDNVIKAGYTLEKWVTSDDETIAVEWDFTTDEVVDDMTLYAVWEAAAVTIKFDLDGGTIDGLETCEDIGVTYGEVYGSLPIPEKEGYEFVGWMYSGSEITSETVVSVNGEHILTATWQ